MKKFALILVVAIAASTSALANGTDASSISAAGAASFNEGNEQNINFEATEIPTDTTARIVYSGTQKVKNVPSMGGANLTSSNDTCMGSTSAGVAVAGFGLNIGSTWTDKNCTMLKNSRELWNYGMKAAALSRMCMDELNKEALELTGYVCPTKKEAK